MNHVDICQKNRTSKHCTREKRQGFLIMAMYNSSVLSNEDDTDVTVISHSMFYNQPATTTHTANTQTYLNGRRNYTLDEDDTSEATKQIERILDFYRKELTQESNTQLHCDQQLMNRLFDFLRPAYSCHRGKMINLDKLFEEILNLQDTRFIEQKEKTEQLQNEILHLKKLIITSANEGPSSTNTMTKVYRINSMVDYEQWMAMEEETKKLHNLIDLQRERIDELIKLISQEMSPFQTSTSGNVWIPRNKTSTNKQRPIHSHKNTERTISTPDRCLTNQQPDSGMDTFQRSSNEFHSFGTSSIHSLPAFVPKIPVVDTGPNEVYKQDPSSVISRTLPLLSRISSYHDKKKCPICNYEFRNTADEFEMNNHVEACLNTAAKQYKCPNCMRQFPDDEEKAYLQHLADCFAEDGETF